MSLTPKERAAANLYDLRNRVNDARMFIEIAVSAFDGANADRAEMALGQAVPHIEMLEMLVEDARRSMRAFARPEMPLSEQEKRERERP